ncbi:MAG: phosphoribosylformylglycinamidine cyclo-ligase [bacterium]|nr:phosphoribosylformylglycinamidine cyclo-ligase [bacterium]MDT8395640.1 phosphoribosylformylglycinamidine cyclo-ligase [bacterium]
MKETRYSDAGVDISSANEAKKRIGSLVKKTHGPEVLGGIGGFGGLFSTSQFPPDAVLVSSIDGVGTKLKVAFLMDRHETVGQDIVNHCINDILVQGARPLFFLDYLATGHLVPGVVEKVVQGICAACRASGCALLGGETAEMPGFYDQGEYDLAGTIIGVVGRGEIITGDAIGHGDTILGLASSGLHTNGYSLARKVLLEMAALPLNGIHPDLGRPLGDELLEPHRSYAPSLLPVIAGGEVHGMVHITGGGFGGNIPRVVPGNLKAIIRKGSWPGPPIFDLISRLGNVPEDEMYATFNMGLGMLVIVSPDKADKIAAVLLDRGEKVYRIGSVEIRSEEEDKVIFL